MDGVKGVVGSGNMDVRMGTDYWGMARSLLDGETEGRGREGERIKWMRLAATM